MKRLLLILSILIAMVNYAKADNFVTDVMVIGGTQAETNALKTQYENQGWTFVNQDLNAGASGDYIYLLYKTDSDANPDATFITYFTCGSFYYEGGMMFPAVLNQEGIMISPAGHYVPVPCAGDSAFVASKGNLNRGTDGNPLYLYYTKESNGGTDNPHIVKSITFNSNSEGAMPNIDLNSECGGNAPEIYMHPDITQGWVFWQGSDTECIISAYDGPKAWITEYTVPTTHDDLYVIAADVFSGFINLETLIFWENSHVTQMPSMQGCTNFKHVNVRLNNYVYQDQTPPSMTSIPNNAFIGTAIEKLTMTSVTQVGAYAFEGCNLSSVAFIQSNVQIGNRAFANISRNCTVTYSGSVDDWSPNAYVYSPNLVVNASDGACGWCGGTYSPDDENNLYWTLTNATGHLNIDWLFQGSPEQQVISSHRWNKNNVQSLTLNHVYTIGAGEFQNYTSLTTVTFGNGVTNIGGYAFENCTGLTSLTIGNSVTSIEEDAFRNCTSLTSVTIPNSVTSIGRFAFYNCSSLKDLYFDGTKAQWNNVTKGDYWIFFVDSNYQEHWRCTVTFNANGHGTAPAPQTNLWSNESKATQPTAPTASGYVFTGWYTDAQGTTPWNFGTDIVPDDMTLYAGWDLEVEGLQGSGTDEDPYLISNNGEWIWFAQSITNGTTYAGQTVKLTADIAATVMAGSHTSESNYHAFSGTFDGNGRTITLALSGSGEGTALFSDLKGATLKNLKAQGSVTTDDRRPATFAVIVFGNSTISNCWSTVALSSTRTSGWIDGGGFVGRVSSGAMLNMTDCAFHGSVTFTSGATTGGSMVGYTQSNATVNLTNCLYSPSALTLNVSQYNPRIFVSGQVLGNLTNCYYNAVAAASVLENQGIDASGMSNEELAAALGPNWTITDDLVVPFLNMHCISSAAEWNAFATAVNNGKSYSGQLVVLTTDIPIAEEIANGTTAVTTMAGTNNHPFRGTLDGGGHTITLALSGSGEGTALFYMIDGATLKNMKVQGTVATDKYRPATFAAFVEGNSTISRCWSTVAVSSTRADDWVDGGGFVGCVRSGATLNMTDCAFHGSVTFTPSATTGGGMVGYTQSNATVNLTNCLYSPSALTLNVYDYNPRVFVSGSVEGNLVNCYYNNVAATSVLENQGIDASEMSNEELVAALGPNWTITDGLVVPKWMLTFTKAIAGYGTGDGSWQLIASPVGTVNPQNVTNLLSGNHDLYAFVPNPSDSLEWHNYATGTFNLESGKGYLYANADTVTLFFTGAPIAATDSVEMPLVYDSTDTRKCWNLVGNPFPFAAYLDREYYVLDADGTGIDPEPIQPTTPIQPCTAVFVKAVGVNDRAVFSVTAP